MANILAFPPERAQAAARRAHLHNMETLVAHSEILAICLKRLIHHADLAQTAFETYEPDTKTETKADD